MDGEEPQSFLETREKTLSFPALGPFPPGGSTGARLALPTAPPSHRGPFPLPAHRDTQHPPQITRPARLGWARVLQRCHHLVPRGPRWGGPLFSEDTAWLPPGRGCLRWVSQPHAASQVQQGPGMVGRLSTSAKRRC